MEPVATILVSAAVLLVILWAAYQYRKFYKSEHFVCPNCGHCWKPPVRKLVFSVNAVEGKIIRCPQCSEKVYVEPVPDKTAK